MVLQSKTKWRPKNKQRKGSKEEQEKNKDKDYTPQSQTSPHHKKRKREIVSSGLGSLGLGLLTDEELVDKLLVMGILLPGHCDKCETVDVPLGPAWDSNYVHWRCKECNGRTSVLHGSIFQSGEDQNRSRLSVRQLVSVLNSFLKNDPQHVAAVDAGTGSAAVGKYYAVFRKVYAPPP